MSTRAIGEKKLINILATFFFFLLFCFKIEAQKAEDIDSLKRGLEHATQGREKIDFLNELSFQYRDNDSISEGYAMQALKILETTSYEKGKSDAYTRLGTVAKNRGDYKKAEDYLLKALEIRKKSGDKVTIISAHNNLGILYRNQGHFEKALWYYTSGLDYFDESVKEKEKTKTLNGIAVCYFHLGQYENALKYNIQDIELREKLNDPREIAISYLTSGNIYQKIKNYQMAESNYSTSLSGFKELQDTTNIAKAYINLGALFYDQNDFDKAFDFFSKARDFEAYLKKDVKAVLYRNLGTFYEASDKIDSSLMAYAISKQIVDGLSTDANNLSELLSSQTSEGVPRVVDLCFSIGFIHKRKGEYAKAIEYFLKSLDLLDRNKINDRLLKKDIFDNLSESYSKTGDFKQALEYGNLYKGLNDSLSSELLNASNYKANYEKEKRINEKLHLEKMQTKIISYAIIFIVLTLTGVLLAIKAQRRKRQEMAYKIDELLSDQEISANYARLEGQDEERKRIAQDLHDRLGSMLSTVKLYFSALDSKVDLIRLENREQYNKANNLLDEACEEVRRVAQNLESGILKKYGLPAQLKDLAETIQNSSSHIKIELIIHKFDERLEMNVETNIYRIIQEIISNTLKHAKANKLSIQLSRFENIIHVFIEDNGIGFDKDKVRSKGGMGLRSITQRIETLKGTINIDSVLTRGTAIAIDIPYRNQIEIA
ncbi:MAG: tetratricopeptide repeat protein [Saprospiraceae bacterium]